MPQAYSAVNRQVLLPKSGLADLISLLQQQGYSVLGPTVHEGVISLGPITSLGQLARGVRDEQSPGKYRLVEGDGELYFQYTVGPESPKRYLFPPVQRLFKMHVEGEQFVLEAGPAQPPKLAILGLRPCELKAIEVQDRVFGVVEGTVSNGEVERYYRDARRAAVMVVVNCTRVGGTCFCVSMGTGPKAKGGFDLALTELRSGFVMEIGSPRGAQIADQLPVREANSTELELAEVRLEQARHHMGRELDTDGLVESLRGSLEHPYWDEIAKRCLGCTNCTMVCPTCFCNSVEDGNDLNGGAVSRTRKWDSCYTLQFSYTTAGPIRASIRARHRHWVLHKLCTWWEQFGCSGCVGCGRCITWCPVGIDITEDAEAVRDHRRTDRPVAARLEREVLQ